MIRSLVLAVSLFAGAFAQARQLTVMDIVSHVSQQIVTQEVRTFAFNFKKGDQAKYSMNMSSFIKGSMEMNVLDVVPEGVWIQQMVDMGFAGKQDVRQLMDPNTGEIKRYIVNGQEQKAPDRGQFDIIDSKEDTVTVPAGTFTCLYIKANVEAQGQKSEVQQWVNPKEVPVMGMVKMIASSQFGPVTAELLSFKRN